jgi:hypothetical protein
MKSKTLASSIRECAKLNRDIILPEGSRTYRSWPLCLTCLKEVDGVQLEDINETSCEIRAFCYHGTETRHEDSYKVEFGFRTDGDPLTDERANWALKRAMHDFCPFPTSHQFDFSPKR